ncbi:DUF6527 family protein [Hyphomonas sp. NPDC076900]|uniref:DUF6527 family protein n=1 Tax=unclassified Hyphomonas TaxID=2630699 RepID=UPI003D036071
MNLDWLLSLWRKLFLRRPDFVLRWHEGDTPPEKLEQGVLLVASEDGELWAAAFLCPCKCGDRIELALIPEATPHWHLTNDAKNTPTLRPSVWRKTGCRSHFWLRDGRIHWC